MKTNTLSKIQSLVAIVVFTFGLPIATHAQTSKTSTTPSGTDSLLERLAGEKSAATVCREKLDEYTSAFGKIKNITGKASEGLKNCLFGMESSGRDVVVEGEEEEEGKEPDACENFRNSCSILDGISSTDLLKDAQKDMNDAQKEMMEAQQNAKKNQKELQREMTSIQLSMKQGERTYQLKMDEIQKELDAANKAQDQALRKAVAELRANITKKRNDLTAINDSVRQAEVAVAAAKTAWESGCRTEAYQKYDELNKEIKKLNQDRKTKGTKIAYAGSNLAGASNRKEDKDKRKLATEYASSYKECIAGVSGAGASAKGALANAEQSLASTKASATERRETLQKEIADLMSDYADLQTSTAENKDTLRKSSESKVAAANTAYQNTVENMNKKYSELQEDLTDAINFGNQATQIAMQNANSAQLQLVNAQTMQQCNGMSGGTSKTSAQRAQKQIDEYETATGLKEALCNANLAKRTCLDTESQAEMGKLCDDWTGYINDQTSKRGKSSKAPAGQ